MRERADYLENNDVLLSKAKELKESEIEFVEAAYDKDLNPVNWFAIATKDDDKIISYHFKKKLKIQ